MHLQQTFYENNKQIIIIRTDHAPYGAGFVSIEEVSDSPS